MALAVRNAIAVVVRVMCFMADNWNGVFKVGKLYRFVIPVRMWRLAGLMAPGIRSWHEVGENADGRTGVPAVNELRRCQRTDGPAGV